MPNGPIRRAQLITPFGVGAMVVVRGGISVVATGLDHWYESETGTTQVDEQDFYVEEWRLQELLGVSHFRLPPDYREKYAQSDSVNIGLTIPFLRFPQWHFCPSCNLLLEVPLSQRGKVKCPECIKQKKTRYMFQVPFVAVCSHGHLQDFPWREWVHRSVYPTCHEPLRLSSTGSATLSGQKVRCDCGVERTLAGITEASPDGTETHLSSHLSREEPYLCPGKKIWLGQGVTEGCALPLRGSLRNASNVYYAQVFNAVYLPRSSQVAPAELVSLLESPPLATFIGVLKNLTEVTPEVLRRQYARLLQEYSDSQITDAIEIVLSGGKSGSFSRVPEAVGGEGSKTQFRREEFRVLREERDDKLLSIKAVNWDDYDVDIAQYFSRIMLVDRLRETRVLAGFTRIFPDNDQSLERRIRMLWARIPSRDKRWLPAYTVFGEGIYFELDEELLQAWETREDVCKRIDVMANRYREIQQNRQLDERPIVPRFILLHTFAHLLMNRLTFECGYSSASLRERLYVSANSEAPMAGLLIYTAAGDAEGTMGGLVRMGKPGQIEQVIRRALENAKWCSADPVCMEIGSLSGQGPDSCNLAACHNCALVPETACEEFNRFLDRAVVIGHIDNPDFGFFRMQGM